MKEKGIFTKPEFFELIKTFLKDWCECTVENVRVYDSYYLTRFGDNSVYHFTIKEIPGWLFAVWLRWTDETETKVRIDFFGTRIKSLNKFKPRECPVAVYKCDVPVDNTTDDINDEILDMMVPAFKALDCLRRNKLIAEYYLYNGANYCGFFRWVWEEWWYEKAKPAIKRFFRIKNKE